MDAADPPPPALAPISVPRRTSSAVLLAAVILAAVVVVAAVLAAVVAPSRPARAPTRFGPGTEARVASLVERVSGHLLTLRTKLGDFSTRSGGGVDPFERREATARALYGLVCAKRLGAKHPALDETIASCKRILFTAPGRQVPTSTSRTLKVSIAAATVLALAEGVDPTDGPKLPLAVQGMLGLTEPGPPAGGWGQAIAARAYGELLATDRAGLLASPQVERPTDVIPLWENLGTTRDAGDPRVSEAYAMAVKAGEVPPATAEIFAKVLDDRETWTGGATDLLRWVIRAWLAGVVPGGEVWFERILPELEKAVGPDGRIEGEIYGYEVSRSSDVLILLAEGSKPRGTGGGGTGR